MKACRGARTTRLPVVAGNVLEWSKMCCKRFIHCMQTHLRLSMAKQLRILCYIQLAQHDRWMQQSCTSAMLGLLEPIQTIWTMWQASMQSAIQLKLVEMYVSNLKYIPDVYFVQCHCQVKSKLYCCRRLTRFPSDWQILPGTAPFVIAWINNAGCIYMVLLIESHRTISN